MTIALVDMDIVCFRCAASCEPSKTRDWVEPLEVAVRRAEEMMERILVETQATSYKAFLTGQDNFRKEFNPEYKANRKDKTPPRWLQDLREHAVLIYNASVSDGQEADDEMGIAQDKVGKTNKWHEGEYSTVICSIDKDLLCIPGRHYNFVTMQHKEQSPLEAIQHFYYQLLMGDKADNIFGFDGLARQTIPQKLQHVFDELFSYEKEQDMFEFVRGLYNDDERLLMNGICLRIRQTEGEIWTFPV
ncbi:MAG: hypothetical protein WAV48_04815 [Candidatus Magasanikiibacteriota bacterium]